MRKAKKAKRRELALDPVYKEKKVSRFVNCIMEDGKKNTAYKIFYNAMDIIDGKIKNFEEDNALDVWKKALENITPMVEVRSRRIGGATFQIPQEVRPDRKIALSMKNMISFARQRNGKTMSEKLAAEIMAAYKNEGGAFKKKDDMHKMAESNKAFAHFRF
ncbi:MAG: 30S ribosomal protein S7 [Bacteroidota bacterium]